MIHQPPRALLSFKRVDRTATVLGSFPGCRDSSRRWICSVTWLSASIGHSYRWASMKRAVTLGVLASIVGCFTGCISEPRDREREVILSLPWQQFDQTLGSGWRIYSARRDYQAAADVIEVYLRQHPELTVRQRAVSHFHAGQMRVYEGCTKAGVALMKQALVPEIPPGLPDDWNIMVSAHIAFLTGDRATLVALKARVVALPPSRVEWPDCPADLLEHFGQPLASWKSE
jgi:hypothetical protein